MKLPMQQKQMETAAASVFLILLVVVVVVVWACCGRCLGLWIGHHHSFEFRGSLHSGA